MRIWKATFAQLLSLIFLLVLAAFPLVLFSGNSGEIVFNVSGVFAIIKVFFIGLFSGDSYYFTQGDRSVFIFTVIGDSFADSFYYLIIAGISVLALTFLLGIWFWKVNERFFGKVISLLGILPDFILILLLQLFVTIVYKNFGIKLAKVASFDSNDTAVLLPIITLIIIPLLYAVKALNEKTKDVLTQDYILTAIAKGVKKKDIYLYHVTANVTPYLKADLHKILAIMISNLFIVEYIFNLNGITALFFQTQAYFGYQYNLVIFCLVALFLLYGAVFFLLYMLIIFMERILKYD
ncbi:MULTISPECIES: ABC transporter permease subunit [Bacillaceae]|uniref:ABC transporter permease subunit n=1 Tax=Bacillaceae TaxID=186817 RepID=UPI001E365FC1|nr:MULTISPECIES: ABC transporter permease subunit [Bacillaceae]MCE4049453.1 ABC transporter permease subunit [Bacillus sp. Au-Bac7]MCM3029714.1 ABC transporter permease subunit [Niallia sp. MER 6]UPO87239.1 ABC transporter permease subunit [Niallia sp. Man26]